MSIITIKKTTQLDLCIGCGICKGICPKQCISWEEKDGLYVPGINHEDCIACGLCAQVCPGLRHQYPHQEIHTAVMGRVLLSCNAWSKDPIIRHISASGGTVSTLISTLLKKGTYDAAFLVDTYDYRSQLKSIKVTSNDVDNMGTSSFPKSRYLAVSHEIVISYIKINREKRVIFVGTSCAVRGFLSAVRQLGLDRDQYLVIGLFCDRVFTYNVLSYYQSPMFCGKQKLVQLHFKNKESGGWPGNMKFFFSDGSSSYQDKTEREKVKDYFMPERCLYCIDKLNVCADISLGDNYTQQDSSSLGSNSVIVRTERGLKIWEENSYALEIFPVSMEKIWASQHVDWRLNNYHYGKLKERSLFNSGLIENALNEGVICNGSSEEYLWRWKESLRDIYIGQQFETNPSMLFARMRAKDKPNIIRSYVNRVVAHIRRSCKKNNE